MNKSSQNKVQRLKRISLFLFTALISLSAITVYSQDTIPFTVRIPCIGNKDSVIILSGYQIGNPITIARHLVEPKYIVSNPPDLQSLKFNRYISLSHFDFRFPVIITNTTFEQGSEFIHAQFSSVYFTNTSFADVNFMGSEFKVLVYFILAQFHYDAQFEHVHFDSIVNFSQAKFYNTADFSGAIFKHSANFSKAEFGGEVNFNRTTLPDSLNFQQVVKITNEIDFTKTNKKQLCMINLIGSDISKIKIDYQHFKLWFPKGTGDDDKIITYEKLKKKFTDDGDMESMKALDIEYKEFKNTGSTVRDWLQRTWWNYGYDKDRIVTSTIKLLLIFILPIWFFFPFFSENIYVMDYQFIAHPKSRFYLFFIKILNSIIYSSILFFGLELKQNKFRRIVGLWTLLGTVWVVVTYVTGLISIAYLADIIILK